jgi:hypothetical protein
MPERIGFCFIRLRRSSLKRLAKRMFLNLRGKTMIKIKNVSGNRNIYSIGRKKIVLEEVLTGIMFFLTLAMAIVNMFLIMNLLDK